MSFSNTVPEGLLSLLRMAKANRRARAFLPLLQQLEPGHTFRI
jgi:hypothetical protein